MAAEKTDDLISRSALIEVFEARIEDLRRQGAFQTSGALLGAVYFAERAPTIDAVPVVKCKDCIYKGGYDCPLAYAIEWGIGIDAPGDDDYCSAGKRMDADAPERAGQDAQQSGEVRRDG